MMLIREPDVTGLVLTFPEAITRPQEIAIRLDASFGGYVEMYSSVNTVIYNKGRLLGQASIYVRDY